MDVTAVSIRAAEPEEAPILTDIAIRAKASHGYDEAFMESRQDELTVRRDYVAEEAVFVVDEHGSIAGFYAMRARPPRADLDFLFIEPVAHGKGYGRRLWDHAVAEARALHCTELFLESDPFAEPFYLALGAERVGDVPSGAIPGRTLTPLRAHL